MSWDVGLKIGGRFAGLAMIATEYAVQSRVREKRLAN